MIKYPNGKSFSETRSTNSKKKETKTFPNLANRGISLESDINNSNEYYKEKGLALITKRPTPINIVKVDYSHGARITDAYFEKQSTTDYNGVYRSRYLDFEAKSTKKSTSFPLHNITPHQISHLHDVMTHGGIAFFIISFENRNEVYLLDAGYIINFLKDKTRKSIPYEDIKQQGVLIVQGFYPRLNYLEAVNEVYFHEKVS